MYKGRIVRNNGFNLVDKHAYFANKPQKTAKETGVLRVKVWLLCFIRILTDYIRKVISFVQTILKTLTNKVGINEVGFRGLL